MCIFADRVLRCKPQLVFHGKEKGQKAREVERLSYHKDVDVLFNDAA